MKPAEVIAATLVVVALLALSIAIDIVLVNLLRAFLFTPIQLPTL